MFNIEIVRYHDEPNSEYMGRGNSPLGNPYPIEGKQTRDIVCDKYEKYLYKEVANNNTLIINELKRLHQKGLEQGYLKLGCFCVPKRCHVESIRKFLIEDFDIFLNPI